MTISGERIYHLTKFNRASRPKFGDYLASYTVRTRVSAPLRNQQDVAVRDLIGGAVRKSRNPTIVDVAKRAGVSVGTVSRVLNGVANCAPVLRERVQRAIRELDYVPNHAARSLKRRSTEQIELVVPDIANPVYVAMAKSVQQVARERGYRLSLISTDGNPLEESLAVKNLERQHVDGLVICSIRVTPGFVEQVTASRHKVCVIGKLPPRAEVDSVHVDSVSGAALAVKHLAEGGRKTVALVNGDAETVPAEARFQGYRQGLMECGLVHDASLGVHTTFTMHGGYSAAAPLLAAHPEIDAIFCANDLIALGVMRRLRELGRRVPEDVAVVGVDNIDHGKVSSPTLTSVSLLAGERGRLATELLTERLASPELEPRSVVVTPRLIVRESSTDYIVGARPEPLYVSF